MLHVHDPGRVALHKAVRTAVVQPTLFALCLAVVDDVQMALFAGFGAFAMLAFADFGGTGRSRAAAYLVLTALGLGLIPIGTLLGDSAWQAAVGMAIVAFAIVFAGSLGGYYAAGGTAAILAFVLAVALPADAGDIPARLAGWGLAGGASCLAALVLWRQSAQTLLIRACTLGASALVGVLETWISTARGVEASELASRDAEAATAAVAISDALHRAPYRPTGPGVHDRALSYLAHSLRRGIDFAHRLVGVPAPDTADQELAAASAESFRELARFLEAPGNSIDLAALGRARLEHAARIEHALAEGELASPIDGSARRAFVIRIVSFIALSAGANAVLASGGRPSLVPGDIPPVVPEEGAAAAARRLRATLRTHLYPGSVWFQAGLRAAVGLGTAILIALLGQLQHAFWVALGTLTALKSNAVTTSFAAWQALAGTVVGLGLAAAFIEAGGETRAALWVALPICVFLAVYTPTAVHAAVGQAMFTVMVVVLFNLVQPVGWRVGLVRVEDILIGAGASLVVGIALWPRGARGRMLGHLSRLFDASGAYVREAIRGAFGRSSVAEMRATRARVRDRAALASDAYTTFLDERGSKLLPAVAVLRLLTTAAYLRFVGDSFQARTRAFGTIDGLSPAEAAVIAAADDIDDRLRHIGHVLADPGAAANGSDGAPAHVGTELDRALDGIDRFSPRRAIALVWMVEWIEDIRRALDALEEPLREVREVGARRWWA